MVTWCFADWLDAVLLGLWGLFDGFVASSDDNDYIYIREGDSDERGMSDLVCYDSSPSSHPNLIPGIGLIVQVPTGRLGSQLDEVACGTGNLVSPSVADGQAWLVGDVSALSSHILLPYNVVIVSARENSN